MIAPLVILAIGAVLAGYLNWPSEHLGRFLGHSPSIARAYDLAVLKANEATATIDPAGFGQEISETHSKFVEHSPHFWLMLISGMVSILGIYGAYLLHLKDRARAEWIAADVPEITNILEHKYWIDEIYEAAIIRPLNKLGRVLFMIDRFVIDGIVWLISFIPQLSGFGLKLTTQRGYLQGYAVTMIFGIAVILIVVFG